MVIKAIKSSLIYFTEEEKRQIIEDYLRGGSTKKSIWEKYTGRKRESGQMLGWMRQMGYKDRPSKEVGNLAANRIEMDKKHPPAIASGPSFERLQLENRIALLEQQLKDAELKATAFSTMVDIAEKEFKIPIRKKFNTKP